MSKFISKFKSKYLWGNLAAMLLVVIVLCVGVKYSIDLYTHHGESIAIPSLKHKKYTDAEHLLANIGLEIEVSDTGYVKSLPAGCILEQSPAAGEHVKSGHIIYVTINSPHTPTLTIPDIIDNSSLREAMAKLTAMGFRLGQPEYVSGESEWVYGIVVKGRHVVAGDKVPIDAVLTIQAGNGQRDSDEDINYVEPESSGEDEFLEEGGSMEEDNFEVVPGSETPAEQPQH